MINFHSFFWRIHWNVACLPSLLSVSTRCVCNFVYRQFVCMKFMNEIMPRESGKMGWGWGGGGKETIQYATGVPLFFFNGVLDDVYFNCFCSFVVVCST